MNKKLNGKTVLITGASSGLGEQLALKCAENGANLVLIARSIDKLKRLKDKICEHTSVNVSIYQLDIGDLSQIEFVFKTIFQETESIDVLINNAGFGVFKYVVDATITEAEKMFQVNVLGLIAVTKQVLPKMLAKKSGHIINIASQGGKIATPKASIYSATKKAVLGFTDSLRMEVRDANIYVTAVNPGPIATNFFTIADESGKYLENVGRWILKPDYVAEQIIKRIFTPVREINLPKLMNIGATFYSLFPNFVERIGKKAFFKK